MNRFYLLTMALLFSLQVNAQQFNVTVNSCNPGSGLAAIDTKICNTLETELNKELTQEALGEDIDIEKYASGSANAQFAATAGQGTDYATNFNLFYLAASAGAGYHGETDDPTGLGIATTATIGFNASILPVKKLWVVDFSRLKLFANIFSYSIDRTVSDTDLDGDAKSFGIHGRYEFIKPKGSSLLGWRGVSLGFGISKSSFEVNAKKTLDSISESVEEAGKTYTAQTQGTTVDLGIDSDVTSIDFEVASGFRVAYFLSLYGGVGAHIVSGSTKASLNGDTKIEAVPGGGGFAAKSDLDADVDANLAGEGDADSFALRAFLGVQINVPFVALYVQANKLITEDALSAQFGLKISL